MTARKSRCYSRAAWHGAVAAALEVDGGTGEVRIFDMAVAADAGKAIHYRSACRQIEGGAIVGVGMGLFERLEYGDDALRIGRTLQCRFPLFSDVPSPEQSHTLPFTPEKILEAVAAAPTGAKDGRDA